MYLDDSGWIVIAGSFASYVVHESWTNLKGDESVDDFALLASGSLQACIAAQSLLSGHCERALKMKGGM